MCKYIEAHTFFASSDGFLEMLDQRKCVSIILGLWNQKELKKFCIGLQTICKAVCSITQFKHQG